MEHISYVWGESKEVEKSMKAFEQRAEWTEILILESSGLLENTWVSWKWYCWARIDERWKQRSYLFFVVKKLRMQFMFLNKNTCILHDCEKVNHENTAKMDSIAKKFEVWAGRWFLAVMSWLESCSFLGWCVMETKDFTPLKSLRIWRD